MQKMFLMETYDQKARVMTLCHLAGPVTAIAGSATVHQRCTNFPKCWSILQDRSKVQAKWGAGLEFGLVLSW